MRARYCYALELKFLAGLKPAQNDKNIEEAHKAVLKGRSSIIPPILVKLAPARGSYGLNLTFLVVTSAAMGNPSWIFSFSISP